MQIDENALEAAVLAYDCKRCEIHGAGEKPMSQRNRESIAPMIAAAIAAYEAAEARVRELEAAQEWQPIGTAPHGINVLLAYWDEFTSQWKVEVGMASWGWRRNGVSNISLHGHATHWMLLPNPPAAECSSHD